MDQTIKLGEFFRSHKAEITETWLSSRKREEETSVYSIHMPKHIVEELRSMNGRFIDLIINRLTNTHDEQLEKWGNELGEKRARFDSPIHRSIEHFTLFRGIFWEYFESFLQLNEKKITTSEAITWGRVIDQTIDEMITTFTQSFSAFTEKRLKAQQEMIDELNTPVISITDGVAVLPLIGDIDTHRARTLMEHALNESLRKEVNCLIIDLSGVLVVDTMVAQELFKIIGALELTGVEVTLTGMRPELAQSVVTLGIKFDQVKMYNNLNQALKKFGIIRMA